MSLQVVCEIWHAISHSVAMVEERRDLAEQVVAILIDNDYSIQEIKQEFEGERLIQTALKNHADFDSDDKSEDEDDGDDWAVIDDFDDDEWD